MVPDAVFKYPNALSSPRLALFLKPTALLLPPAAVLVKPAALLKSPVAWFLKPNALASPLLLPEAVLKYPNALSAALFAVLV